MFRLAYCIALRECHHEERYPSGSLPGTPSLYLSPFFTSSPSPSLFSSLLFSSLCCVDLQGPQVRHHRCVGPTRQGTSGRPRNDLWRKGETVPSSLPSMFLILWHTSHLDIAPFSCPSMAITAHSRRSPLFYSFLFFSSPHIRLRVRCRARQTI